MINFLCLTSSKGPLRGILIIHSHIVRPGLILLKENNSKMIGVLTAWRTVWIVKVFFFQLSLSDVLFWWQINVLDLYLKCSLKLKSWWFTDHECTCASWQLSTYITMKTIVLTFLSRCLPSSSYQCYSIFPIYDRFQSSFYSGHNTCQFYVKI